MRKLSWLVGLTVGLLYGIGCSSELTTYPVTGNVILDGQPVLDGDIHFVATSGRWGAEVGKIRDGRYHLMAKAGPKRVEITASKILPKGARGAGGEPVPEEYIPERYNMQSILTAEVTPKGSNQFDFKLESKKK